MSKKANWYEVRSAVGNTRAQVFIFGVIVDYKWDEDDVTAKEFIDAIKPLGDFDLRINSPGGSVPAGNAIYNALRRHKGAVDVYIEGIAASMASVIAMAGQRVVMPANAMFMIHDPWAYAVGNAAEMRKAADTLEKFKVGMVAAYQKKCGMEPAEIERLMTDETWITAAEAVEMGFADEIEEPMQMAAHFDLSRYRNVPKALISPKPSAEKKGATPMTLAEMREKHPDLVAQIEAAARQGTIALAEAETARAEAVTAECGRVLALVTAAVGEESGKRISAAAEKGLTAEDLSALGVSLAPVAAGGETEKQMLEAITGAADKGVQGSVVKPGDADQRKSAVSAIAAGGSIK